MVLVDASDVIFATVKDGAVRIVANELEGHSKLQDAGRSPIDARRQPLLRAHRSYLVNIDRIKEVLPWFKSTYQLRMSDRAQPNCQ